MGLIEKINEDLKTAMKEKDRDKVESIRAIKNAFLQEKTKEGATDITEATELKILQKLVKQRKDSADIYKRQGRDDLAEKESKEAAFIEKYLPEQMSEEKIEAELRQIIEKTGASTPKDIGKVMGMANKIFAGKADMKVVSQKVKSML